MTTAYLRGGDLKEAAAVALLKYGAATYDARTALPGKSTMSLFDDPMVSPGYDPGRDLLPWDGPSWEMDPLPIPDVVVEAPMAPLTDPYTRRGAEWNFKDVLSNVSGAALAALQLTQAWNAVNRGQTIDAQGRPVGVNPQSRTYNPSTGQSHTALDTGVVVSTDSAGRVVSQRPPKGIAQSTITGNLIVNNGDNTYTLIAPDGSRRVIAYGPNTGGDGFSLSNFDVKANATYIFLGIAAVGLLLKARK